MFSDSYSRVVCALGLVALVLTGCGDDGETATTTTAPTTTTTPATTTTLDPMEAVSVEDPETGQFVTFAELVEMRQMVEVQTDYGPVWLDRDEELADSQIFADGVAYMIDNCANLAAADLLRSEGIDAVLLVCLEDGNLEVN